MLTFAYKVGGWVWPNAYVTIRITNFLKKYLIDLRESLPEFALFEIYIFLIKRTLMTNSPLFSSQLEKFDLQSQFSSSKVSQTNF